MTSHNTPTHGEHFNCRLLKSPRHKHLYIFVFALCVKVLEVTLKILLRVLFLAVEKVATTVWAILAKVTHY